MTDVADADAGESDSDAERADAGGDGVDADAQDAAEEAETEARDQAEAPDDADGAAGEAAPDADGSGGTADGRDVDDAEDADRETDDVTDELVARVATVDEAAAAEVEALRRRVDEVEAELEAAEETLSEREAEVEELESKLTRARADFQNYKKRSKQREEELRERATEDLVERLLDVRDNLVRALQQDDDVEVRDGVEATLATFDRVLDAENVSAIEPEAGGDVDPERHEVVHRTESDRPEGAIDRVYRPGYEMAGKVLRPAQVTVSEGPSAEPGDDEMDESDAAASGGSDDADSDASNDAESGEPDEETDG